MDTIESTRLGRVTGGAGLPGLAGLAKDPKVRGIIQVAGRTLWEGWAPLSELAGVQKVSTVLHRIALPVGALATFGTLRHIQNSQ